MEGKSRTSVTLVNKYYPPNNSVTAEACSDLAQYLLSNGIEVNIVHTGGNYQGGGGTGNAIGKVFQVKSSYDGKNKLKRLFASISESRRLINKASELNSDAVIIMTSPPLLNYFASRKFKSSKKKWLYWALDLFPEAFHANKLVSQQNPVYQYILKKFYTTPPSAVVSLGNVQADYLNKMFKHEFQKIILPCGVFINSKLEENRIEQSPEWAKETNLITMGYIGNLGEAHSVDFLKQVIDCYDPQKIKLIMVLYGSKSEELKEYIRQRNKPVQLFDFVNRAHLKLIDIHLSSLNEEWVNVCVPSKIVSAVYNGSSYLFYGPEKCDSWQYLNEAGWRIAPDLNSELQIQKFLDDISLEKIRLKKEMASKLSEKIASDVLKAYDQIKNIVTNKA